MKIALNFMSKDRVELSRRTIEPLLNYMQGVDLWWMDGSITEEGQNLPKDYSSQQVQGVRWNVRGGPDAAVAYAVTECLKHDYTHIGIVENDVLLQPGWFDAMGLFEYGATKGLTVGAVSARCYEDRVLFQRDGYNVVHNLGFGMVIWTREAAQIMLRHMRTSWTLENRRTFMQLSGIDIGHFWAFRLGEHWLCADWGVDRVLAAHGLASVALDPSPVEMIGQIPSLAEQGLTLATGKRLTQHGEFGFYADNLAEIRAGTLQIPESRPFHQQGRGQWLHFAHHVPAFPQFEQNDKWRLKWVQGFGPFAWVAEEAGARISMRVSGPCGLMASGGEKGAQVRARDMYSGYEMEPVLRPAHQMQSPIMSLTIPGSISSRVIEFEALEPGAVFHGISVEDPQPFNPLISFTHATLPPV